MLRTVFLITLLLSSQLYATEVYRSIDKNGRTIYSGEPPQNKEHDVVDIEIKNKLGTTLSPSPNSQYYRPTHSSQKKPQKRVYTGNSSSTKTEKLDMKALQEKCESYRNASNRSGDLNKQREKRDYWCGRLHRGK